MSDKLVSPNGAYELDLANDGNLVTYRLADGAVIWSSGGDPNPLPPPTPPVTDMRIVKCELLQPHRQRAAPDLLVLSRRTVAGDAGGVDHS